MVIWPNCNLPEGTALGWHPTSYAKKPHIYNVEIVQRYSRDLRKKSFNNPWWILKFYQTVSSDTRLLFFSKCFSETSSSQIFQHYSSLKTHPSWGLVAYDGDWWVYRLLLLISRVMPVALRPMMPPNFQVLNPILLRILETWIMEGMGRKNLTKKKGIRYNIYMYRCAYIEWGCEHFCYQFWKILGISAFFLEVMLLSMPKFLVRLNF